MAYNKSSLKVYRDTVSLLTEGWPTPLVRLKTISTNDREAWAKLEFYNPFSRSVKDRPVWNMLRKAFRENVVVKKIYETSSGNVAISLAALCNIHNIDLTVFLPKFTPQSTKKILAILNAKYVETDYESIIPDFWRWVSEKASREGAINLNQFENDANPEIHYETLAREIIEQLESIGKKPDMVFAGIGTSGHIYAIWKRVRKKYGKSVKVIGVQPAKDSRIPGIKRIETGPKWISRVELDAIIDISREEAIEGVVRLARTEGLLVGLSSGAVYQAYRRYHGGKGVAVLVFPDDIYKYIDIVYEYLLQQEK